MRTLAIRWERLVNQSGGTCQRCESTEKELHRAVRTLRKSLSPLGIEVSLEKKALHPARIGKDPSESNRVWIGGQALEEWLHAQVGKSPCASCCAELGSDVECRTIEVGKRIYETIPAELIVRAGLVAASRLLADAAKEPCCASETSAPRKSSCCWPESRGRSGECDREELI